MAMLSRSVALSVSPALTALTVAQWMPAGIPTNLSTCVCRTPPCLRPVSLDPYARVPCVARLSILEGVFRMTALPPSPAAPKGAIMAFAYAGTMCYANQKASATAQPTSARDTVG